MVDAIVRDDHLAGLHADYSALVRQRRAALMDLSARVFNRPGIHDAIRGSQAFRRWRSCSDEAQGLESQIDQLGRQLRSGDTSHPADRSTL